MAKEKNHTSKAAVKKPKPGPSTRSTALRSEKDAKTNKPLQASPSTPKSVNTAVTQTKILPLLPPARRTRGRTTGNKGRRMPGLPPDRRTRGRAAQLLAQSQVQNSSIENSRRSRLRPRRVGAPNDPAVSGQGDDHPNNRKIGAQNRCPKGTRCQGCVRDKKKCTPDVPCRTCAGRRNPIPCVRTPQQLALLAAPRPPRRRRRPVQPPPAAAPQPHPGLEPEPEPQLPLPPQGDGMMLSNDCSRCHLYGRQCDDGRPCYECESHFLNAENCRTQFPCQWCVAAGVYCDLNLPCFHCQFERNMSAIECRPLGEPVRHVEVAPYPGQGAAGGDPGMDPALIALLQGFVAGE